MNRSDKISRLILVALLFAVCLPIAQAQGAQNATNYSTTEESMRPQDPKNPSDEMNKSAEDTSSAKLKQLEKFHEQTDPEFLTTDQGQRVNDDQNSLKAGQRGPTLMEDFHLREKITHFDHERIPERVVHARGSGAHGYFQVYKPLPDLTKAQFLNDPSIKTPVFVRFSTVAGFRGSTDLARDVRGFAVKFYTQEGNYDIVGNNMPVFFIQDAIKFPDLIHAVKPNPHNEIPQAASAHTTFWDFISLTPESMHTIMWLMSDRAIPRSLRMMEGFGIHTFRFVNEKGEGRFVKFHWKPILGVHSVVWDEAMKISGADPDFHRRDLFEAIENGNYPEWELGIQVVEEKDEFKFNFDLLDPTKIIPEELVPVQRVGLMVLNRNPDNFFAETEQVAFHPGNVVSGIDFTNDPLLQGRLFSYIDTQLTRLGGPNFHEIPINRPIAPVYNNQRDGHMRMTINRGQSSYEPNTTGGGRPFQAKASQGGYVSYAEKVDGVKIRTRSESFMDFFSQATLFWNSQSEPEKNHIVNAFRFELGKVDKPEVRKRMLALIVKVDKTLAEKVAMGLGLSVPTNFDEPLNMNVPADADTSKYQDRNVKPSVKSSKALSMADTPKSPKTRMVAILIAEGFDDAAVTAMKEKLAEAGAMGKLIAPRLGELKGAKNSAMADFSFLTSSSVLFDAVYVPGGQKSTAALKENPEAIHFINQAYKHCKPIGASAEGVELLRASAVGDTLQKQGSKKDLMSIGIVVSDDAKADKLAKDFLKALEQHRFWIRESMDQPPA